MSSGQQCVAHSLHDQEMDGHQETDRVLNTLLSVIYGQTDTYT